MTLVNINTGTGDRMTEPAVPAPDQAAFDAADAAAGYRTVLDDEAAAELEPGDPNLAAAPGTYDHENHIGDAVDDDGGVGAAGARL